MRPQGPGVASRPHYSCSSCRAAGARSPLPAHRVGPAAVAPQGGAPWCFRCRPACLELGLPVVAAVGHKRTACVVGPSSYTARAACSRDATRVGPPARAEVLAASASQGASQPTSGSGRRRRGLRLERFFALYSLLPRSTRCPPARSRLRDVQGAHPRRPRRTTPLIAAHRACSRRLLCARAPHAAHLRRPGCEAAPGAPGSASQTSREMPPTGMAPTTTANAGLVGLITAGLQNGEHRT